MEAMNTMSAEQEFYRLEEEYYDRFGINYSVYFFSTEAGKPISWHNDRIREALRTGKPIEDPEPEIPPGILI